MLTKTETAQLIGLVLLIVAGTLLVQNKALKKEIRYLSEELSQSHLDWLNMKGERDVYYTLFAEAENKPPLLDLRSVCIDEAENEYNRQTGNVLERANSGQLGDGYNVSAMLEEIRNERQRKQELCVTKY